MIAEQENELFEAWFNSWAHPRPWFVKDGIVNADSFANSHVKVLFVLKEANDFFDEDLREFLRDGGQAKVWDTVTRWVEGIEQLPNIVPWDQLRWVDEERRRRTLPKIVTVNLKKYPGTGSADPGPLINRVYHDREFIRSQLSLYKPDYVICGGTAQWLLETDWVYPIGSVHWKSTSRGVRYKIVHETPHIEYYHPGAFIRHDFLHYGLIDAVAELLGYRIDTRMSHKRQ